jgi:hypothetical protein
MRGIHSRHNGVFDRYVFALIDYQCGANPILEVGRWLETKFPYQPVYIGIARGHIAQMHWQRKKAGTPKLPDSLAKLHAGRIAEAIKCDIGRSAPPESIVGIRNNTNIYYYYLRSTPIGLMRGRAATTNCHVPDRQFRSAFSS